MGIYFAFEFGENKQAVRSFAGTYRTVKNPELGGKNQNADFIPDFSIKNMFQDGVTVIYKYDKEKDGELRSFLTITS